MVAVSAARVVRVLFPLYLQQRPTGWRRLQKISKLELGMGRKRVPKAPKLLVNRGQRSVRQGEVSAG